MTSSSWYRRKLWYYKGSKEYTKNGYIEAKARFSPDDLEVDCTGRHFLITGGNRGMGLETALQIAKKGGVVHLVCRNPHSAKDAKTQIITSTGNDKIHIHQVDLSKPRDVIHWAELFALNHEQLHVLIHNAACMVEERDLDEDGLEHNFAVNVFAVHAITLILLPLLQRTHRSRLVIVASAGLLKVKLDPRDLMHENMNPFIGELVYYQNKRQQAVMSLYYAQHYDNVHFSCMHPGWVDTTFKGTLFPAFYKENTDNLRSIPEGADTILWLAVSESAFKYPSGLFFQDRLPVSTHLPMAWTRSPPEDDELLMRNINKIFTEICSKVSLTHIQEPKLAPPPRNKLKKLQKVDSIIEVTHRDTSHELMRKENAHEIQTSEEEKTKSPTTTNGNETMPHETSEGEPQREPPEFAEVNERPIVPTATDESAVTNISNDAQVRPEAQEVESPSNDAGAEENENKTNNYKGDDKGPSTEDGNSNTPCHTEARST